MNKTFFTSQINLSFELISLIDSFGKKEISERILKKNIKTIIKNNKEIMFYENELKPILKQRLGKKRIRILMLIMNEQETY